jgi:hypothetical protein
MSERRIHIAGWIFFILSALGFIVSSLRSGDIPGIVGGVFFLLGCALFLIPMLRGA